MRPAKKKGPAPKAPQTLRKAKVPGPTEKQAVMIKAKSSRDKNRRSRNKGRT